MRKYKGLIFDFNGVLLLDQHLHDEVFRNIATIGLPIPTDDEFKKHIHGRTNKLIFEYLLGKELEAEEVEWKEVDKEHAYQTIAKRRGDYALADGAIDLFEQLRNRNIPFTIGTSSPSMNITFFDEMLSLHKWFDMEKIVCGDGTVRGKPYPDIYLKAAGMLSLEPRDCVVIEDAASGIAAAHAAGIGYVIAMGPRRNTLAY